MAKTLERSEAAVRQLASRAREHVPRRAPALHGQPGRGARSWPPPSWPPRASADVGALSALLAEDAILVTDGGGKRKAALRILVGRDDIIRLLPGPGLAPTAARRSSAVRSVRINGYPGLVLSLEDGPETIAFQPGEDGKIAAVYVVRNPEKLAHVAERRGDLARRRRARDQVLASPPGRGQQRGRHHDGEDQEPEDLARPAVGGVLHLAGRRGRPAKVAGAEALQQRQDDDQGHQQRRAETKPHGHASIPELKTRANIDPQARVKWGERERNVRL